MRTSYLYEIYGNETSSSWSVRLVVASNARRVVFPVDERCAGKNRFYKGVSNAVRFDFGLVVSVTSLPVPPDSLPSRVDRTDAYTTFSVKIGYHPLFFYFRCHL